MSIKVKLTLVQYSLSLLSSWLWEYTSSKKVNIKLKNCQLICELYFDIYFGK